MYYQDEMNKKERWKIIAVAVGATAIILILIVAIVVVATKKSTPVSDTTLNTEISLEDAKSSNGEVSVSGDSGEAVSSSENSGEAVSSFENSGVVASEDATVAEGVTVTAGNEATDETTSVANDSGASVIADTSIGTLPDTGAEEIFPIALMLGMLVLYLSSLKMVREKA